MNKRMLLLGCMCLLGVGCASLIVFPGLYINPPPSPSSMDPIPVPSKPFFFKPPSVHHPQEHIYVEGIGSRQTVTSPLSIQGKARANWFDEAMFSIALFDAHGALLAEGKGHAQQDLQNTKMVPFSAILFFSPPTTATGTLILYKNNPNGDPRHDDELDIPVMF